MKESKSEDHVIHKMACLTGYTECRRRGECPRRYKEQNQMQNWQYDGASLFPMASNQYRK